jgi:hypothetical protein
MFWVTNPGLVSIEAALREYLDKHAPAGKKRR